MASVLFGLFACTRSAIMSYKNKHTTPSEERQHTPQGETLREKASKKIHGEGANPSQLGDPISLKAETSDNIPTKGEEGSKSQGSSISTNEGNGGKGTLNKQLKEKIEPAIQESGPNPKGLVPTEEDEGAHRKRNSKL